MTETSLGINLLATGKYDEARELFQAMLNQDVSIPSRIEALVGIGLCDLEQGKIDAATESFELANQMKPNLASIENLIRIYQAKGDSKNLKRIAECAMKMVNVPKVQWARYQSIMVASSI